MRSEKEYMELAFRAHSVLYVEDDEIENKFRNFARGWGGFDIPILQQVAVQTQDEDEKLIALAALGFADSSESLSFLQPYLQQGFPMEQFISAWSLWDTHRELAFSVLSQVLQMNLLTAQPGKVHFFWMLAQYSDVLSALEKWKDSRVILTMRQALIAAWDMYKMLVEQMSLHKNEKMTNDLEMLEKYQGDLAYVLGKFNALGVLTSIQFDDTHRVILIIYLVLGSLHERFDERRFIATVSEFCWTRSHPIRSAIITILEQHFGIDEAEGQSYIDVFCEKTLPDAELSDTPY